jgi:hypothetical protein
MKTLARTAVFLIVVYFFIESVGIWWALGIGLVSLLVMAAQ